VDHAPSPDDPRIAAFDPHAVAIAKRQYYQPGDETLAGMFRRVADWVATPEGDDAARWSEAFYELMIEKRFCPGGRVLAGAATNHGNVLNCFVQDGSPAEPGGNEWVLSLATKLALVTKVGGGNGLNLDPIRPKRDYDGPRGTLYLTIDGAHPDHPKVRDGTFLDLVHGSYVTKGYRSARFVERDALPDGVPVHEVGDSVEGIWQSAGEAALGLLDGRDQVLDLSGLRAEGTPVNGSGGTSSGPSSFAVEVFDNFATWARLGGADHAGPVATLRYVFAPTLRVIRQGGCLHPDTLVHTSRGTLRLAELVDAHQMGWQDHHLKVATDDGWKDSPRGYNNGSGPTVRVTLANGQTLRGTPRHRVKVVREDGRREWVRLEDLERDDQVIQVLDQHTGAPVLLRPVDAPHHNATPIAMPEILDERLAFFLGYLWGDGFVSSGRVGLAVAHDSPMMAEAPRLFSELFGLDVACEQKPDDASAVFVTKSAHLIAWLEANGLVKDKARSVKLPTGVRMAPRPVLGAFLRGLFEADGTLTHGMPTLATASAQLAEDVATMLAGLGIPTKRRVVGGRLDRYSRHAVHHLRVVSAKGLARFSERVGAMAGSRLEVMAEHAPDEGREKSWILPHARALLAGAFEALPAGAKGRPSPHTEARKTLSRYIRGERNLTATAYDRLRTDPAVAEHLPELAYDEYYVPVHSIEDAGRALTLDLSVDENKTYLAGGFVTHNTRRGAGMATLSITHPDVNDFVTAKDLDREQAEGDISTFNISVLVSDAFMTSARSEGRGTLQGIAEHAWATGEPGLIFVDRINAHNPMRAAYGDIKSTNPCVTADTWVDTHEGARRVAELVDRSFCAVVDGRSYPVRSSGFFSTGTKPVFRVRTKRGYSLRLTADHRLDKVVRRTRDRLETDWTELRDLALGDEIRLADQRDVQPWSGPGSEEEGWLLGLLLGDGTFATDKPGVACLDFWGPERFELAERAEAALGRLRHPLPKVWRSEREDKIRLASRALGDLAERFGIVRGGKRIGDEVERASYGFATGLLRGLFDADGSVQGAQAKGVSARLAQSDEETLERVQRMLARIGVVSSLYRERRPSGSSDLPDGRGGTARYAVRAQHELVVANDNLPVFRDRVGFAHEAKARRLDEVLDGYARRMNRERFVDRIVAIEADGEEEVYDVTVDAVHAFVANGVMAHNCGEIPLYPGEPCDLGALNLSQYVVTDQVGMDGFDVPRFRQDVATCVRFLDDVLEVNRFALEDNREMSMKLRRLGLGVMGLADALIKMGYAYDSEQGRAAVHAMISELHDAAVGASEHLASERAPFPAVDEAELDRARRNVAVLTVAPTGTTSMLMGVSSGVEPVFAPFIYRKIGDSYAALIHPLFQELLNAHPPHPEFARDGGWDWDKVVERVQDNHGSVQGLDFVPEAVKRVLVCAHDIAPGDHVRMQGVVQRAFDGGALAANSISKTINLPQHASVDDVFDAYALAFDEGCKGITVYRDGSRQFQVLSTKAEKEAETTTDAVPAEEAPSADTPAAAAPAAQGESAQPPRRAPRPAGSATAIAARARQAELLPGEPLFDRPGRLEGFTDAVKLTLPTGERRGFYVTVNKQDGLPSEVFILSGKAGDEANADSEALGRVVSIALQYGVPAEALVKTLRGINGGMYGSYQGRMVASKADLLAVALETAGAKNLLNAGKGCPDCGAPLRFEEGCEKCESCGYSKCG